MAAEIPGNVIGGLPSFGGSEQSGRTAALPSSGQPKNEASTKESERAGEPVTRQSGNELSLSGEREGRRFHDNIEKQAQELQESALAKRWSVNFQVDEELGQTVIKVMDAQSKELIRQIPSDEWIDIAKKLKSLEQSGDTSAVPGLLLDKHA